MTGNVDSAIILSASTVILSEREGSAPIITWPTNTAPSIPDRNPPP
jgi:hypothetical protein